MTLEQLTALMVLGNMDRAISIFEEHCLIKNIFDSIHQYNPQKHDVKLKEKRPDKQIKDADGNTTSTVPVARLPIPVQKRIVLIASAFLGCPDMQSNPENQKEKDLQSILQKIWDANKIDYKFTTVKKKTMSERHCAEIWYNTDVDQSYWENFPIATDQQLSVRIIANSLGDSLYPVFDEYGNMIAFGRGYKVLTVLDDKSMPVEVDHFDVYTAQETYMSKKVNGTWLFGGLVTPTQNGAIPGIIYDSDVSTIPNMIGKIPVIYYSQPYTEWSDVQELIDRLEKKISNHADTNDYFDSPIVVATGTVTGFANKGEQGKLLEAENGADVKYLTWNQAPESTKMELENLQKFIYSFTQTPDISFENMKGLGVFSGIAIKMLFMDAHLKASDKEEVFGEGVQRRINYLKKAISVLDPSFKSAISLEIKPKFNYFLPQNITEAVDTLVTAIEANIISQESAVRQNPLVSDPDAELEKLKEEQAEKELQPPIAQPTVPLTKVV